MDRVLARQLLVLFNQLIGQKGCLQRGIQLYFAQGEFLAAALCSLAQLVGPFLLFLDEQSELKLYAYLSRELASHLWTRLLSSSVGLLRSSIYSFQLMASTKWNDLESTHLENIVENRLNLLRGVIFHRNGLLSTPGLSRHSPKKLPLFSISFPDVYITAC